MLGRIFLFVFVLAMLAPAALHAQGARHQLDYRAPADCPDGARFSDEVASRVGYLPFATAGERVEVRILRDDSGPRVELVGTIAIGENTRAFRSGECADLVGTMGSALAVMIDASSSPQVSPPQVSPPQPAPAASAGGVRVRITTPQAQPLTLHRVTGHHMAAISTSNGSGYAYGMSSEELCEAPCETQLAPGRYELAVSRPHGEPLAVAERVDLRADSELSLGYVDRNDLRIAGWTTMGVGVAASTALLVTGMSAFNDHMYRPECSGLFCGPMGDVGIAFTVAGGVVGLASLITAMVLMFQSDSATVEMTPLARF